MPTDPHAPDASVAAAQADKQSPRDHPLVEPQKNYHTVLEQEIEAASEELKRPAGSLLISGFTAGLDVGLGPFTMAVFLTLTRGTFSEPLQRLMAANLYALGFIFVVIGRSALFTEHTTAAILPVFDRRNSVADLLRLWGLVLAGNLAGAAIVAWFAVRLGGALQIADAAAFTGLAAKMTTPASEVIFFSAIGAGWVMGLLSWLTTAARETTSQIMLVWATTFVIGLASLHHSIAGSAEAIAGVILGATPPGEFARFLCWSVLGNIVGGTVMVSALKFSHIRQAAG
jgi:formate/nitrite transporter FocA (FNT family)